MNDPTLGKAVYLGCPHCGQPACFIFIFEFDDEAGRAECQNNMNLLASGNVACSHCGASLQPLGETKFQHLS